ncbi:hypothetical protein Paes_1545 [Prosthecochloris aestuarii DSM 271]|uniref:Uncharacterized protein n=2 Tax=Prosthecochloris aestuarii TaxID=1102 RepID=B4S928_PROA2|nr:hypothetical protein Paes_1545 [Prosthecochloris aestuarii DSM 271]
MLRWAWLDRDLNDCMLYAAAAIGFIALFMQGKSTFKEGYAIVLFDVVLMDDYFVTSADLCFLFQSIINRYWKSDDGEPFSR